MRHHEPLAGNKQIAFIEKFFGHSACVAVLLNGQTEHRSSERTDCDRESVFLKLPAQTIQFNLIIPGGRECGKRFQRGGGKMPFGF